MTRCLHAVTLTRPCAVHGREFVAGDIVQVSAHQLALLQHLGAVAECDAQVHSTADNPDSASPVPSDTETDTLDMDADHEPNLDLDSDL